jgi:hypothetical protein
MAAVSGMLAQPLRSPLLRSGTDACSKGFTGDAATVKGCEQLSLAEVK